MSWGSAQGRGPGGGLVVGAVFPLGALAVFAGTAATAAGPHSGAFTGPVVHRLHFKGADTLSWAIHQHAMIAAIFGVAVIGDWFLHRHRGASAESCDAQRRSLYTPCTPTEQRNSAGLAPSLASGGA